MFSKDGLFFRLKTRHFLGPSSPRVGSSWTCRPCLPLWPPSRQPWSVSPPSRCLSAKISCDDVSFFSGDDHYMISDDVFFSDMWWYLYDCCDDIILMVVIVMMCFCFFCTEWFCHFFCRCKSRRRFIVDLPGRWEDEPGEAVFLKDTCW